MDIVRIASLDDPRLTDYVGLTDVQLRTRKEVERGLYMAESQTVLRRALAAGHAPRSVLVTERWLPDVEALVGHLDIPVFLGEESQLATLIGFHLHRGALAAMQRPELPSVAEVLRDARVVVVLDGLVDHTNVGAAFRSVAGLGADAVLVTPTCSDPLYRRAVRVSMGTVLQVPWTRIPAWPEAAPLLHDAGFQIAALALSDDAVDLASWRHDRDERVAIVLGNEGHGLGRDALAAADVVVRIPMRHGVDSLNVAATSAVALWAVLHG
ncbi:RNA methyltransferase [Agrococcus versicolor]|uniref:RNA methyltransferase n=1 Tax=Agrococcus versicolor TaxID=501482 RepID=A0ABP5MF29_9MICO